MVAHEPGAQEGDLLSRKRGEFRRVRAPGGGGRKKSGLPDNPAAQIGDGRIGPLGGISLGPRIKKEADEAERKEGGNGRANAPP